MNKFKIGLKNAIALLDLEKSIEIDGVETDDYSKRSKILRSLFISILNTHNSPRSLLLEDLLIYEKYNSENTYIKYYLRDLLKIGEVVTDINKEEHIKYLNSQIIYVYYLNEDIFSLNLLAATNTFKLRIIEDSLFKTKLRKRTVTINDDSKFKIMDEYYITKKISIQIIKNIYSVEECDVLNI